MPVRMIGGQHIALSSYWVVLWAMCSVPLNQEKGGTARRWEFVAALAFAVWSHAYLAAMSITLIGALLLSEKRWISTMLALGVAVFLLYIVGVFHAEHAITEGAKAYSLDILAFTESLGWALLPNLYEIQTPTQSDALLYLGTGVWWLLGGCAVLTALGLGKGWVKPALSTGSVICYWHQGGAAKRLTVLLLASIALTFYSMTFDLRVAGFMWLSVDIPSIFEPLYHRFRVTGRFAMPLAYCFIILACLWWAKASRKIPFAATAAISSMAVLLQLGDLWVAGQKSPTDDWFADAQQQRATVASVAPKKEWSGRVFRSVGYFDLEQQRMIDYALVEQGARYFAVAHGARLSPEDVQQRSGFDQAVTGDVVITLTDDENQPNCSHRETIKHYTLCLVE